MTRTLLEAVGVPVNRLRVVAVHAHPDDETLFTGATLAALSDWGAEVALVTCTAGEAAGQSPERRTVESDRAIGDVRLEELAAACTTLGVTRRLLLGDGRWRDSGRTPSRCGLPFLFSDSGSDAVEHLIAVFERHQPHLVLTYEPDGITGHPDHVRAHQLVRQALVRIRTAARQTPIVLGALVPRSWITMGTDLISRLENPADARSVGSGGLVGYSGDWSVGMPAERYTGAKKAALGKYLSQAPGSTVASMLTSGARRGDTLMMCAIAEALGEQWGHEPYVVVDDPTRQAL